MSIDGPWVRFFPSDWLAGTRGMSAAETGVYITLIALMYERTAPIERDDARLARLCGLPTVTFRTILATLIEQKKVTMVDGNLWGRRVGMEVEIRKGRSQKAREAASAKHQQNQHSLSANASAGQSVSSAPTLLRARASEPDTRSQEEEHTDRSSLIDRSVGSLSKPKAEPRPKGTRLSSDWVLPKNMGDWALEQGLPRERILLEAEKMRDWSINAGGKGLKADWFAAWRNWVKKAIDELPRSRGSPPGGDTAIERRKRALAERIENEHGIGRERGSNPADVGLFPILIEAKR